jgi:hypothetical protein
MSLDEGDLAMQPLSKLIGDGASLSWGDPDIMTSRPRVAIKIAECISEWADIETMIGIFLGLLLGNEFKTALAMYASLENRTAQRRMIMAATRAKLPIDHSDLLDAIMRVSVLPVMKERDKLAHWCWGKCEELPELLILRAPADKTEFHFYALHAPSKPVVSSQDIYAVSEKYLCQLADRMRKAKTHVAEFASTVWSKNSPQERDELRQKLSSEPPIQKALERIRADRQKPPASQPSSPAPTRSERP